MTLWLCVHGSEDDSAVQSLMAAQVVAEAVTRVLVRCGPGDGGGGGDGRMEVAGTAVQLVEMVEELGY